LGVSGWGFAEYYMSYRQYTTEITPDLIIVGIYPTNDFYDLNNANWSGREKGNLPEDSITRKDLYMDGSGHLRVNNLRYRIPILRNSAGFIFIMQYIVEPLLSRFATLLKVYSEHFTNVELSLKMTAELSNQTPVLALILPSKTDYPTPQFLPEDYITSLEAIDNLYVLDIQPVIADSYTNAYVDEFHFTAETNKQIAEAIFQFIKQQEILADRFVQ
jgi:hypothetical protein